MEQNVQKAPTCIRDYWNELKKYDKVADIEEAIKKFPLWTGKWEIELTHIEDGNGKTKIIVTNEYYDESRVIVTNEEFWAYDYIPTR